MTERNQINPAIDGLFDIYEHEHAIETIKDWAGHPDSQYTESQAETVDRLMVKPLWEWIGRQGNHAARRTDVLSALELVECAESDIVYGLRYRQKIYPEHVRKLDYLWREFQRIVGSATFFADDARVKAEDERRIGQSIRQSINAGAPRRKDVTKEALDKFLYDYEAKHGRTWGWKSAACIEFDIDFKTLNSRIISE